MAERELVVLDVKPGGAMESQSGLIQKWPRIYCALAPAQDRKAAAIVVHPTSNFMGHYLMPHLPAAGVSLLALNTRYIGNDSMLLFERVIQDLGAGVKYLRDQGYERIVLLGNSGGASTLTSWLSQWSPESRADGPACLARTSVPVLNLEFSADSAVFPGDIKLWSDAAGSREDYHRIAKATHYMDGQTWTASRSFWPRSSN